MLVIPLQSVPAQNVGVMLAGQPCAIGIFQKTTGLYCDLSVNGTTIVVGVLCLNGTLIVRDRYFGFIGDLAFFDTQGSADPEHDGLGKRFFLGYYAPADIPARLV